LRKIKDDFHNSFDSGKDDTYRRIYLANNLVFNQNLVIINLFRFI